MSRSCGSCPQPSLHPLDLPASADLAGGFPGKSLYTDGTLFHGPSFQGVQRVISLGEDRLVLECLLPPIAPDRQGQFPLQTYNPFVYDADRAVDAHLGAALLPGPLPALPLGQVGAVSPIPFGVLILVDMLIVSHNETSVVADLFVTDTQGLACQIYQSARHHQPGLEALHQGGWPCLCRRVKIDPSPYPPCEPGNCGNVRRSSWRGRPGRVWPAGLSQPAHERCLRSGAVFGSGGRSIGPAGAGRGRVYPAGRFPCSIFPPALAGALQESGTSSRIQAASDACSALLLASDWLESSGEDLSPVRSTYRSRGGLYASGGGIPLGTG